ncbi:mucin-2-like [Scylla paramamosain]
MKAGCRTPSKGRGPQQGGGLRHLKMPPVKKTSNATKFKAKTTKKESVVNPSTLRRTSEGRTPTKRSSSSSCSESSPKSSSGVSSRSRSSNSSSLSPSRAPSRVTGRSPARRSCGRSPNRGADSAKVNGKGARAAQKGDAGTSKLSKIAENAGGSLKTKAISEKKQDLAKTKKTTSSDSNKSASQSAKVSPAEKGKKSSPKCRRNSESKTEGNAKSSDEKEESDRDGKKKTTKKTKYASASEKQESDKDLKKKTKKSEDKKGDTDKVTKNKSRKSDEKNDTECESKRKSKKGADKVCESPGKVKESKIKEEKDDTEGQTKEECEKDRKQKDDSDKDAKKRDDQKMNNVKDENELNIKQESDEVNKKNDDSDKQPEKKKGKKLTVDDDEEKEDTKGRKMKEDKSEGRKTNDTGDSSVVKSEKEPASLNKDGKLSSPGKRDKAGKGEAKDMIEDGSSNTSKPKKKSAVKKILASEGENGYIKEEKEKKPAASKKDSLAHSEGKERNKSLSSSQETLVPKKRGRPKGSKNKRKNDGLPPARVKKDKQKTEKKQSIGKVTKSKKERSEFSFSESEGEREEKMVKLKKGSKTKHKICEEKEVLDDEENSSSDSSSSDEESPNSFKGISKAKLYGGHTDYPKKVVIGGKVYKLKRETPKSRLNSKKAPSKFHQNSKIKKHSVHVFDSEEESERDMEVNKIVKMRSDYSESSDSEIIKKPKKPSDCLNEETSYDDMSDDDEDWGTRKPRKRQTKKARTRKGMMPLKNNLTERMSEKSDDDKDDDTDEEEEEEEEEDGDDYGTLKSNRRGPMNSKEGVMRNKRSSTNQKRAKEILPPKRNLKSESSEEENDEEEQDVIKKSHKKLSYKNSSRAHKKSSKDASHVAVKKSKKVTFFKKSSRSKDDSSEDEESDKESDSEYEAHSRKRTGKGTLKTKKHIKNNKRNMNPAPPRRAKRMASLNARAMMHCMNEDARIPLPTLPVSTAKNDNMALILRDPVIHDTHSEESDEEDRDYDSDDDKRGKRRKNIKRKNEEENEKKVKIKRKRRRGELDVHMDMRDMVVTKRMASLNASAIMAASYSSESRKRNPTATTTSSSAESEITNVDIKRKISVKSTKERNTTTSSVITVEETTKKVKKAQGSRETEVEEHIIVKKKVKRQGGTDSDQEDGNATDNSELASDILTRSSEEPKGMMEESTCTFITTHTPTAPQTVTISGESTYCITSSDGKTTTMVKQVQRKTTTTGGSTTSAPPTACIPPTHHVQPQPQNNNYPMAAQKPDNYSPLGALSTMQPVMSPGGTPHHHHHHHHHHQPHPPPHHQPPPPIHPSHLPPPHLQPPHHHPPSHHPPPHASPHSYPQSHHHHPHHQPYHPPPSSHPHPTSGPPGHHCGYRPPPQTPPSGSSGAAGGSCQGNHPPSVVGPPMVGPYPSHSSPGYVAPGHTVSPGHSTHPPHHSPKQMASPNQVSPSIKSPQGGSGGPHPSNGSQRPAPLTAGQVERHHSAFTAPAPSTHSPAASTPAGYQPVSGPMPVKPNYTATTSDGSGPYKAPKGSPVAAAPPYSSPPRLTSPPLPIKAPPSQSGSEPYSPPYQYHAYSYHPAPPPPPPPPPPAPHVAPYDKYYPRGATYHFYPPTYSGGQYPPTASSAEYSYPPPPSGGMHYSQESYTSYTLCVPNAPPQGPPQALALPPPPPTSNGPHPPAYATYHYTEYTPVFAYPPTGTIVKINLIGPSSQSTICCPVDPKNVYTWPPTRNGRGSEGSSNSNQCSGLDQGSGAGYQYSYRPTQQPPQPSSNGAPQGCGTPSVYQSGPLTTVMTTGTQPTIQVFGAVMPQQTVTLIPPQESQTVSAPPPSVPPPVPAPVPPVVPLSQPQLTTATTMVAMAPISVTVPLTPGATHASQASTVPAQASTTASGISEPSVPARHHTSAYGSGTVSQLATANSCSTSTSEASSVTALPPQPISAASSETPSFTTAVVTGVPQTAVNLSLPVTTGVTGRTHPVVSSTDRTSVLPQTATTPSQIATVSANSQVSLPMLSPTQTTATIISSKPQSYVAPTQVTAGVVAGVPHHTATSTHGTTAIVTGVPQTGVVTTNVTTAVVTGVPQPSVAPVAVSSYQVLPSSECTKAAEIRPAQCAPLPARVTTTHASTNYHTVTQTLPSNKAISHSPQGAGNLTEVSTTESQLQEQTAKTEAVTQDSVVSGGKPHLVNTHFTTSSVSGAQKTPISPPHMPHSAVASSQESHQVSSKIMMAVVTGVPKPMAGSTHINTAVVSGVPRVPAGTACSPTGATAILAPASHMKDAARISLTDIPKKPLSTIQSSQDTQEKISRSLSPPSDVCKSVAVLHKVSPNQSVQHFAKAASIVSDSKSLSHVKDAIDLTIAEPQTTKPRRALEAHGNLYKDGMQNTCSVPPMDESGVIIRDCIPAKKRKINCSVPAQTIEPSASVSTAISTPLTPPSSSVGCLSSRNWSPTQPGITSDTVVSCASNSVNEMPATPSLDNPSAGVQGLSKVQGLSVGEVRTNLNSFTPSPLSLSSLGHNQAPVFSHPKSVTCSNSTSVVCSSVTPPPTSQAGGITSVVRDVPRLNVHTDVAQNKDNEGNKGTTNSNPPQQGYQRSGPRHLLCQTLPTPTLAKTATAPLAKPKSSSTSNVPKLLVKSEEKPKDVKPNIMGNVPINQSTSLSFELSSNVISNNNNSAKEELESDFLDVKTDLAPIVRKRGRPPKTRDTSSDSNTSETSTPNSSAPLSQETKKSNSPSKTLQNANENETQKNKSADGNSQGGKILRSRTEEKKKENSQSSSISPSLSKQAEDSKADIKPAGAMNIKTEVLPKIKTEKVSPKGSAKMSSFKMCPKDVSHFKTKIVEGPDEIPLKSGSIPKKFDLPSPSKGGGVTETLKPTKVLRDMKKPNIGLLSDQRVPKNSLVASKSKSKEAADKKSTNSNNNVKRRSGENVGVGGKGAASSSTKTSAAEGGGRTSVAGKNQTSKSQKAAKSTKATSRRSPPNGRLNRKKSLLSYLKEDINESDTSSVDSEVVTGGRKRSRSKEDPPKSNSSPLFCPSLPINAGSRRRSAVMHGKGKAAKKPRWVHNWSWEGEPFEGKIWLRNDELELDRTCYRAMRHKEGDIVRVRDCVLLRSGPRKTDLPFVAKIASLWEDPETSDMMMSILWYYRPEHTDSGRRPDDLPDEIFASKHRDHLSVACIEDRCYVLTFNEYCRYRRLVRFFQEGVYPMATPVPDPEEGYCRKDRLPPGCVVPDLLFFCRRVYDYRIKRLLKNPY